MLPSEQVQKELEEFVCFFYGAKRSKIKEVNKLRHRLFKQKFEVKNKVIDLSLLPPCLDSLRLHMNRSSYIAKRYRLSKDCNVAEPDKTSHGWEQDGQIHWMNRAFPEEVVLLVFDDKEDKEQDYEEESNESDESKGK